MATKAGRVAAASFTGTPKKATVSFGTAFPSTDYAVTLGAITINDAIYRPTIESLTVSGFTINLGTDTKADLTEVGWQAITDNP